MAHYTRTQTSFPRTNDFSDQPGLSVPVSANNSSSNYLPGFSQVAANAHAGPIITVADDNRPGPAQQGSRKRQRSEVSRRDVAYPRKRAITACRQCRARKVKCNNARPTCGNCDASKASCSYEDTQDFSTFDPASIVIIDKLSQVLSRLDQIQAPGVGPFPISAPADAGQPSNPLAANDTTVQPSPGDRNVLDQDQSSDDQQDQLHIPSSKTNVDSILQWPIFGNKYPPNYLTDAVYELEAYDGGEGHNLSTSKLGSTKTRSIGIDEDGISDLVRRYLDLVYIKNPILDIDTICAYTRDVVEDGLRWDAPSCLVLLTCALGCVATPYVGRPGTRPETPATSLEVHERDLRDGEAYYNLARRRFGLLEVGILPSQCYFLAGVYNMYIMRPLAAWSQFQSATKSYYLYLQCQARMPATLTTDSVQASKRRSLEQRLYWSCYKSECELRAEINLPNSSLADVRFTDMHPSPPNMDEDVVSPGFGSSPQDKSSRQQEQTWFYYLTEITLRRLSNRILNLLYTGDHTIWKTDSILLMADEAEQIEKQIDECYARLPPLIQFSDDIPTEELPYHVRGRVLEMRNWLYTPFLYYEFHTSPYSPHRNRIKPFVDKAIPHIFVALKGMPCEHRHHGTWYGVRNAIARCLLIIGAVRCGTVPVPDNWRDEIQALVDRSRFWAAEGPGITRGIAVLEALLEEEE